MTLNRAAATPTTNAAAFRLLASGTGEYLVDSPPGAGKTTLVADVAAYRALELGQRVLVATLTNSAADEVCRKLAASSPAPLTFRLRAAPEPLPDHRVLRATTLPYAEYGAPHVAVATLARLAYLAGEHAGAYDVCLVDEAYLVLWKDLAPAPLIGRQLLLIGDPGQLPPVVGVQTREWVDLPDGPHQPAPVALQWRRSRPDSARPPLGHVRLAHTFRLRPDAAALVQRHFYPRHPFAAARPDSPGRLLAPRSAPPSPGDEFDGLIDAAGTERSVVLGLLPAIEGGRPDVDMPSSLARLVARLLARTRFGPAEVAVLVSHREAVAATRACLREQLGEGGAAVWCDTVERAQGREWSVVVGLHPLSGVRRATPFALAVGRACVMLSRATVATLLLCREGVRPALDALDPPDAETLDAATVHRALLLDLWRDGRVVRCPV